VERLLDLHDEIMEMGAGFWVKITAHRISVTAARPHGIDYSLCLFSPADERLICYDNAHPIAVGSGPAKKQTEQNDHVHKGETIRPYAYKSAGDLLEDFWKDVEQLLKKEGVP